MKRIAIAGGIGAGKTAVTDYLMEHGYVVVDADVVARKVVEPGEPAWRALVDAFGRAICQADATLDRQFLADVVFNDAAALRRLNAVTHTAIGVEIVRELDTAQAKAAFVALPLFRAEHRSIFSLDAAWSVQADPEIAVQRLLNYRGFTEADARARIANQITNDEREALVDHVIWNNDGLEALFEKLQSLLDEEGL